MKILFLFWVGGPYYTYYNNNTISRRRYEVKDIYKSLYTQADRQRKRQREIIWVSEDS